MEIGKAPTWGIEIGERLRVLDEAKVADLAESMKLIGLKQPISVWVDPADQPHLVAGRHRLAAAVKLGWEDIDCIFVHADEIERRLWEIAENLHRAELTVAERAEHIAEWVRLVEDRNKRGQVAQVSGRGGRGKESGASRASRELGIERTDIRRAAKIAALAPAAKQAARDAGLDDNQSALLAAARHSDADDQVAELQRKAAERAVRARREHGEVKDVRADAREILAHAIADYVPELKLSEVTAALALLGLKEVAARVQSLTGAVFDRTAAA